MRLRWGPPSDPVSRNPLRDTLLVYGGFAAVIVLLGWITGGSVLHAVVVAAIFYALATGWTLYQRRRRGRGRPS
jgi:Flp pilus assembly protein TadB